MGRNLANRLHSKGGMNGFCSGWQPGTSGMPQGSILVNIFVSDLNGGLDSILPRFADDTKLWWGGHIRRGAILQRDLGRLGEARTVWSLTKVLDLGQHNQQVQYRLGSVWLRSSLGDRDLWVLVDNKLNVRCHCSNEGKSVPELFLQGHY